MVACRWQSASLKRNGAGLKNGVTNSVGGGGHRVVSWQDGEALDNLYREAALTVISSRYETFGLVALESLSFWRPVVAFRRGGLADTLCDGVTGRVVDELNAKSLAQSVSDTLESFGSDRNRWSTMLEDRYLQLEKAATESWMKAFR